MYVTNLLTNRCVCAAISKQGCGGVKVSTAATQKDEAMGKGDTYSSKGKRSGSNMRLREKGRQAVS